MSAALDSEPAIGGHGDAFLLLVSRVGVGVAGDAAVVGHEVVQGSVRLEGLSV